MSTLKELTQDLHDKAENMEFVKRLFNGGLSDEAYYIYLQNQAACYYELELAARNAGVLDKLDIHNICRADKMKDDLAWYDEQFGFAKLHSEVFKSTYDYQHLVHQLSKEELIAHLYVRHFGDMYGGQMIARKVKGPGNTYKFDNVADLKEKIRNVLSITMVDQARLCFEYAIRLFEEVEEWQFGAN